MCGCGARQGLRNRLVSSEEVREADDVLRRATAEAEALPAQPDLVRALFLSRGVAVVVCKIRGLLLPRASPEVLVLPVVNPGPAVHVPQLAALFSLHAEVMMAREAFDEALRLLQHGLQVGRWMLG